MLRSQSSTNTLLDAGLAAPCDFLLPTAEIQASTISSVKYFLDPLAHAAYKTASANQQGNRKRKRSDANRDSTGHTLQLEQLFVDGFTSDQIWEQAVRILNTAGKNIQHDCDLSSRFSQALPPKDETRPHGSESVREGVSRPDDTDISNDDDSLSERTNSDSDNADMGSVGGADDSASETPVAGSADQIPRKTTLSSESQQNKPDTYTRDRFGLNDGFFSIDDFNRQSKFFENSDAKGLQHEPESDDDEINWAADPLTGNLKGSNDVESDEDMGGPSDDEEGPTLDTAYTQRGVATDRGDDINGANQRDAGDSEHLGTATSGHMAADSISDNDVNRAAADVRRDLFDEEMAASTDDESALTSAGRDANRSAHEKQRARIADEIRRLEAANVSKKEWVISGEARAAERPLNSLIEEDLEFDRIGKPVPVITNEISESIEELVKRRIIAKEFDEVKRRYPGIIDSQSVKKGRIELDDTKSKQSLTELYETDHLLATTPNYSKPENQKLMRVHAEITAQWKEISFQLDTLANCHYKPNAPQADISVVADVATVTMEDARPTAGGNISGAAALAPQEIYAPGDARDAGELILKSGMPIAKGEMSREAKSKRRRQQKKQKAHNEQTKRRPAEMAKQKMISDLKQGGVKVIGKQGEVTDIHGNKPKIQRRSGGDTLKL